MTPATPRRVLVAALLGTLIAAPAAAQESSTPVLLASGSNLQVRVSGRVHRMIQVVDDGRATDVVFTDSAQGPTMLRFDITGKASETLSVGGALEVGLQQNSPIAVSQDRPDAGIDVSGRVAELFIDSTKIGRFSLGRGFAAAWVSPEIDLSGTQFASLLPVGNLFPGLKFVNSQTKELTDVRVFSHFADIERFLLADRLRYDSPRFGGLRLSASVAADARWDLALRANRTVGDVTIAGASTYQHEPFRDVEWRWDAGLSARHEPTGLNLTAGGLVQRHDGGRRSNGFIVKAGWRRSWLALGPTAASVDVTRNRDVVLSSDSARSVGAVVVQSWSRFGVSFYAGIRRYSVDRPDVPLEPILVFPVGALIAF